MLRFHDFVLHGLSLRHQVM